MYSFISLSNYMYLFLTCVFTAQTPYLRLTILIITKRMGYPSGTTGTSDSQQRNGSAPRRCAEADAARHCGHAASVKGEPTDHVVKGERFLKT